MVYQLSKDHSLEITKIKIIGSRQPAYKVDFLEHYKSGPRCLNTYYCEKDYLIWEYGDEIAELLKEV